LLAADEERQIGKRRKIRGYQRGKVMINGDAALKRLSQGP